MCADDIARTLAFMRALHQATLDVRAQFPSDRPVRVLYAGSGPYATLALPTMALLDPARVRFTILDLHEASVSAARASVEELGFAGHVDRIEVSDACEYRIDPARPPDIILTETMQSGLENESQVVIARHLMAQAPEAMLLPERVTVSAYLMDPGREFTFIEAGEDPATLDLCPSRIRLGPIFELSRESIAAWGASTGEALPAGRIRMPTEVDSAFSAFLCTEIQVYRDLVLGIRDSGLTTPRTFPFPPGRGERAGGAYQFTYHLAAPPGLRCEVVEEDDLPAFPLQGHGDVIP